MTGSNRVWGVAAVALMCALVTPSGPAYAMKGKNKPYPTTTCVSAKQKAVAGYCGKALKAWAKWEKTQDAAKRDASIAKAAQKVEKAWTKAESKSTSKGADCVETTGPAGPTLGFVDSASGALVDRLNMGLDLADRAHVKCAQKVLKAAAGQCAGLLNAESKFLKQVRKSSAPQKRDAAQTKARQRFGKAWSKAVGASCATTAGEADIGGAVDALVARVAFDTTSSPSISTDRYDVVQPTGSTSYEGRELKATCIEGTPYAYFVQRGTVNKLLYYFQGGGACWDQLTCGVPVCKDTVDPVRDNPSGVSTGFADLNNPDNPFRDWHKVFVSYCSCDIHFGDAAQDYTNLNPAAPLHIEHRGFQNSKIVEKFAREHFVNPERVFVTGSSAGAYGAWFHGPLLQTEVWPAARFDGLADAGNGVITQDFLTTFFPNWNFSANVPAEFPEIIDIINGGSGIPGYTEFVAKEFPDTNFAHYSTAFDGGTGGQTGFYNIMLNDNDTLAALTWWDGSCQYNADMRSQAMSTAAAVPSNYRYYIGTGSRHTMFGSDKVYDDTTGGVPTIVDWVNAMMMSTAENPHEGWVNVECTGCGLTLAGDPQPNPPVPPFMQVGQDVVIDCPGTP